MALLGFRKVPQALLSCPVLKDKDRNALTITTKTTAVWSSVRSVALLVVLFLLTSLAYNHYTSKD